LAQGKAQNAADLLARILNEISSRQPELCSGQGSVIIRQVNVFFRDGELTFCVSIGQYTAILSLTTCGMMFYLFGRVTYSAIALRFNGIAK
jgi:hypothetical protein